LTAPFAAGIEPEALNELANANGYRVELSGLRGQSDGAYDAVFTRNDLPAAHNIFVSELPAANLSQYVNNPQQVQLTRQLIKQLRGLLQESLPEYMVPSIFTRVDVMPLSHLRKNRPKSVSTIAG